MQKGVEILSIGTELLLGNIVNSNSRWIAEELASIGMPHYIQSVVGDNPSRIKSAILEASKRSRYLITTGGLGPTPDDITTKAIADTFQAKLIKSEQIWKDIKSKLSTKKSIISSNNEKQAYLPLGATIIPNTQGTAPGIIWTPKNNFTIITFPGVPSELKEMWQGFAKPWLIKNGDIKDSFSSSVYKISGIAESKLAEQISDLLESKNPTVATYASLGEVKVRVTSKASNIEEAKKLIMPIKNILRERFCNNYFGSDSDTLASILIDLLRERGESLAVAESCSGGALGAELCSIPGASDIFFGGVIAYNNCIKQKLLNVPQELLAKYGAVSKEVADSMADGVRNNLNSDWGISISGIAGPGGGTVNKPVGLVHIAIKGPGVAESKPELFSSRYGRNSIQKLSVIKALDRLRLILLTRS